MLVTSGVQHTGIAHSLDAARAASSLAQLIAF